MALGKWYQQQHCQKNYPDQRASLISSFQINYFIFMELTNKQSACQKRCEICVCVCGFFLFVCFESYFKERRWLITTPHDGLKP